jgi:dTDP-4-dehydrorhamnose 3,5-epimerase-like enzyme
MKSPILSKLDEVRLVTLPRHARADGDLVVAEMATGVPFGIGRLFVLRAPAGSVRGEHAHRRCSQFMMCVEGSVEVSVDDANGQRRFLLDSGEKALLVPPMIWNVLDFRAPQSVVTVLCDRRYEADDYVRERAEFVNLRKGASA